MVLVIPPMPLYRIPYGEEQVMGMKVAKFWSRLRRSWKWSVGGLAVVASMVTIVGYFAAERDSARNRDVQAALALEEAWDALGGQLSDPDEVTVLIGSSATENGVRVPDSMPPSGPRISKAQLKKARFAIERYRKLRPGDPQAHFLLATYYALSDDLAAAQRQLEKVADVDGEVSTVGVLLTLAMMTSVRFGQDERARALYQQAIRSEPKNPDAHAAYALFLHRVWQNEQSIREWETAVRLDSKNPHFRNGLAHVLTESGRPHEGLGVLLQTINIGIADTQVYDSLGVIYSVLGRHTEAEQAYRKALELSPSAASTYWNLAISLRALGRSDEAKRARERARLLGYEPALGAKGSDEPAFGVGG